MANVIPREGLALMRKRNFARYLLIGAWMLGAAACIAVIALAPAYLSIRIARAALDSSVQEALHGDLSADQATAVRTQGLITALKPILSATTSPTALLAEALAQKPGGVSITSITFTGSTPSLVLSGTSERREAVSAFRDALQATGKFADVAVPVAALVGTEDGKFTVTLTGF